MQAQPAVSAPAEATTLGQFLVALGAYLVVLAAVVALVLATSGPGS